MTLSILYGNRESGHAYKVKLALALLGIEHDYREVDLAQPREQRRADFRAVSPYGEVPVLVDSGVPLAQSNAILLHLARRTGRLGGELDQRLQLDRQRSGVARESVAFRGIRCVEAICSVPAVSVRVRVR